MNVWQYDQLTVGYNLHFHTHNEIFEHFFCLGLPGVILFILLIYYTFLNAQRTHQFIIQQGGFYFFMFLAFGFFGLAHLPLFALAVGFLTTNNENGFIKKTITKSN